MCASGADRALGPLFLRKRLVIGSWLVEECEGRGGFVVVGSQCLGYSSPGPYHASATSKHVTHSSPPPG